MTAPGWIASLAGSLGFGGQKRAKAALAEEQAKYAAIEKSAAQLEKQQEALKQEIRRFSNICNFTRNILWQRDASLKITYCNLAFAEVAEQSTEKLMESGEMELYRGARDLARKAWDSGEEQNEHKHIVVNGERRLFRIREVPNKSDGCIYGYGVDITELEKAKEELQQHLAAQADLLESSTHAMAVFGADTRIKFYNFAYVNLWKLDDGWLDSQPTFGEVLEQLRENRKLPEQANFPAFKQRRLKLFTDLMEPEEEFFYLPDGRTLRSVAIPHALGGLIFSFEDVTDRLALERSYNTLIAVQRETLDNLHEGVVVFGENGRMRLCNPVFLSTWRLDSDWAGTEPHINQVLEHTKAFFHVEDWDKFKSDFIGRLQSRGFYASRIERTDGAVLDWSSVPLPDGATLLTFIDVTASTLVERSLREKNEALAASDKLKSAFLANVSYELRSPLTSISGFSDMLRKNYFGDLNDKQREYLDGIYQSSQHLSQLITDILDLASIEAGYMQLHVSEFGIEHMLQSVIALIRERARTQGLTVALECPADIGNMQADETRLKQVMFNLLSNAIQYSPENAAITVGACINAHGRVELWVRDEGEGIAQEEQEKVFEKFYRASGREQQIGSGLGLSIVKSFVELHGGLVALQSAPGAGTTVTILLPRESGLIANAAA